MWVVPDEESLPCKLAVQILVALIQLVIGLLGTDPHTHNNEYPHYQSSPVVQYSSYNIHHYYWLDLIFIIVIHTKVTKTGT